MNTATQAQQLLDAAVAAGVVKSARPFMPKDPPALPMLVSSERARQRGAEDESLRTLSMVAAVTFWLVTDMKTGYDGQPGFAGSDAALAALAPVYEQAGWRYVRDRQTEAVWGVRDVITCQLFLSRETVAAPAPSSTFTPEPGL